MNAMLAQIETAFAAREQSEARLRRFVADASHELRTPLTSIRGYAELFRRGAAQRPEDLATAMRRIEEEATRMSALVDDLLQLARLDLAVADRRETVCEPVDLARIATDAATDLRAVEPERPVALEAAPATTTGDEAALRQVAANLVANARHHTPAGTAVTVRSGTTAGGRTFIEVEDAGPGMSEADAAHVFERFWRGDPARTRGHGGAGLGLAIVAAIAEAHGGDVALDTAPGRGSRFRVELPASTPPRDGVPRPAEPAPGTVAPDAPGAPAAAAGGDGAPSTSSPISVP
jgi:two-component system OmpR family sensor kinase